MLGSQVKEKQGRTGIKGIGASDMGVSETAEMVKPEGKMSPEGSHQCV